MAETSQGREEDCCQETTDSAALITFCVGVCGLEGLRVEGHSCGDGEAEHFREEKREDETDPSPGESFDAGNGVRLVDCIISCIARPSCREAEDRGCETENTACFAVADFHGEVDKSSRVGEFAEDDEEDDKRWDPGVEFVVVDYLVAEKGDDEGRSGDDDDTGVARDVAVHGVEELGANNDVDGGPADAGEDVENSYHLYAPPVLESALPFRGLVTSSPAEVEAGEDHLAEAEDRTECGKEADGSNAEEIDEEDCEEGVNETELEDGNGEGADGEGGDDHVSGEPLFRSSVSTRYILQTMAELEAYHCPNLCEIGIRPFILRHSLNSSLFNGIFAREALGPGIQRISNREALTWDSACIVGIDG